MRSSVIGSVRMLAVCVVSACKCSQISLSPVAPIEMTCALSTFLSDVSGVWIGCSRSQQAATLPKMLRLPDVNGLLVGFVRSKQRNYQYGHKIKIRWGIG